MSSPLLFFFVLAHRKYDAVLKKANEIEAEGFKKIPWSLNYKESEFRDGLTGNFLRSKFVEGLKRVMLFGLMSNQPAGNGYNAYSVGLGIKTKVCGGKKVSFTASFAFIGVSIKCFV